MSNGLIGTALRRIRRHPAADREPARPDLSQVAERDRAIVERALPYTMTGVPRIDAVVQAVRYCEQRGVPGAFAECGVWRGGSVRAMILTLQQLGIDDRDLHLYDTFEGMTTPGHEDTSPHEPPALETWRRAQQGDERPWGGMFEPEVFGEESVRETLLATGYPEHRIHIVKGPVEETIPAHSPGRLALLRLDTDWYESTRHELHHLYPLLANSGVLIIDDYGHWEGARRAVDEYFEQHAPPLLLHPIDYTGRIAVKH